MRRCAYASRMHSLLRRAEPLLVPLVVLVGVLQIDSATGSWGLYGAIAWILLLSLPLVVRHRYPATAACVLAAATLAYAVFTDSTAPFIGAVLAFLIGFYSAGAWAGRRPASVALGFGLLCFWTNDTVRHNSVGEYASSLVLVAGPWLAGRALRAVRRQNQRLLALAAELHAEREARAEDAVLAERARFSREMHDVVGHSLSVISLHTQAARAALDHDPSRLGEPLDAIGAATRTAMAEMRRLVAMLAEPEEAPETPAPRLRDLPALVEEHRASGLDVQLDLSNPAAGIPLGVELAAYRIVQEGLTNVRRHTAARHASVHVRCAANETEIAVIDEGPAVATDAPGGHGLAGAAARADSCGGSVQAGPHGTGWVLRAWLPYDMTPAA
jgi:signal transduction histidine kinase